MTKGRRRNKHRRNPTFIAWTEEQLDQQQKEAEDFFNQRVGEVLSLSGGYGAEKARLAVHSCFSDFEKQDHIAFQELTCKDAPQWELFKNRLKNRFSQGDVTHENLGRIVSEEIERFHKISSQLDPFSKLVGFFYPGERDDIIQSIMTGLPHLLVSDANLESVVVSTLGDVRGSSPLADLLLYLQEDKSVTPSALYHSFEPWLPRIVTEKLTEYQVGAFQGKVATILDLRKKDSYDQGEYDRLVEDLFKPIPREPKKEKEQRRKVVRGGLVSVPVKLLEADAGGSKVVDSDGSGDWTKRVEGPDYKKRDLERQHVEGKRGSWEMSVFPGWGGCSIL